MTIAGRIHGAGSPMPLAFLMSEQRWAAEEEYREWCRSYDKEQRDRANPITQKYERMFATGSSR